MDDDLNRGALICVVTMRGSGGWTCPCRVSRVGTLWDVLFLTRSALWGKRLQLGLV